MKFLIFTLLLTTILCIILPSNSEFYERMPRARLPGLKCQNPRPAPKFICPVNIQGVCGYTLDGEQYDFASDCEACKNKTIKTTTQGACQ